MTKLTTTPIELYDGTTEHLPTKGWLAQYMRFTDGMEICPRFRFFTASAVLGAAINNKVWVQRGDEGLLPKLFPNLWTIILAPPGRGHKTTAINIACNLLSEACEDVRILADKLTPEYLVKALSAPATKKDQIRIGPRDATGLIKAPEMSVFFGKQQYNVGLVSLITDLYDYRQKWTGGTIGRGGEVLLNNCISTVAGSTPAWLQQMLPQDAFTGGFMSRFVVAEMPPAYYKKVTHPRRPKDIEWKDLVKGLRELSAVKGQFKWTKDAEAAYDWVYEMYKPTGDPQRDAYYERSTEQVLKLAMQLELDVSSLTLTDKTIMQAHALISSLEAETNPRIDRLATHPRMQIVQDLVDCLRVNEVLSEGELLTKVYKLLSQGERQFYEALSVAVKTGMIEPVGKPGHYSYRLRGGK